MRALLKASEMGTADRLTTERFGIPSLLLMENAASAVAETAIDALGGRTERLKISVFCGPGNNGGDGAAAARLLWKRGARVRLYLFADIEDTRGDARLNFQAAKALAGERNYAGGLIEFAEVPKIGRLKEAISAEVRRCDIAIDALFGTGLSRPVEGDLAFALELLQADPSADGPLILSVDIPSGLDADRADPIGPHATADMTVTFTAPKLANLMPPAGSLNGRLTIAEIGTPSSLVEEADSGGLISEFKDAAEWLKRTAFSDTSYKKTRGTVLLVAGSRKYSGAAALAANGAIESGVGMVTLAVPKSAVTSVAERAHPEVITIGVAETASGTVSSDAFDEISELAGKVDALGIGSGLGSDEGSTRSLVRSLVESSKVPVVIDADGLNSIAPMSLKGTGLAPLILTPHQGEFLRLLGSKDDSLLEDRLQAVREFSRKYDVITVLKGARTLVGEPGGRVVLITTGNSGLGKAGNGDNLTGIVTGFAAQARRFGIGQFKTAVAAVHLAGLAGDIAESEIGRRSMLASDVRRSFQAAVRKAGEQG